MLSARQKHCGCYQLEKKHSKRQTISSQGNKVRPFEHSTAAITEFPNPNAVLGGANQNARLGRIEGTVVRSGVTVVPTGDERPADPHPSSQTAGSNGGEKGTEWPRVCRVTHRSAIDDRLSCAE